MALVRQFIFGIDSEKGLNNTYSFPNLAEDQNGDSKAITCAYAPRSKSSKINISQPEAFLGGNGLGKMYRTFRKDLSQDDGNTLRAEAIMNGIDPTKLATKTSDTKRFIGLEFSRINPVEMGLELSCAFDVIDPHIEGADWTDLDTTDGSNVAGTPSGIARAMYLRIIDETITSGKLVFDGFIVRFLRLRARQGAE